MCLADIKTDAVRLLARGECPAARREGRVWLDAVGEQLDAMTAADALQLVDAYDLIHRMVYGSAADDVVERTVRRALHADDADEYLLYRAICRQLRRGSAEWFGKPLTWCSLRLERYYNNFKNRVEFDSPRDLIQQGGILLSEDLWAFEPDQQQFKQTVLDRCLPLLADLTDAAATTQLLSDLHLFLHDASAYLTPSRLATLRHTLALSPQPA